MFYENQPEEQKIAYKNMLRIVGKLSRIFSDNESPYLYYRAHENIFCKYFEAENLSREDCSADAIKNRIGIGLKTWMGTDDQKIAEFGKLRPRYEQLTGLDLVKQIAEYRNKRIRTTKNIHGLEEMIYHIVKREPGLMNIIEYAFDYIDIDSISIISNRGNENNIYFTDDKHIYHFSLSKNTLFMIFSNLEILDTFYVDIMNDPYDLLNSISTQQNIVTQSTDFIVQQRIITLPHLCLRLYSTKPDGTKYVPLKSGINQWNGARKDKKGNYHKRNINELYIPYPAEDRARSVGFFPDRDTIFKLSLPDGTTFPAKICQSDGKAIMSNPNKLLGEWLLRKVFEVPEGMIISYEMLELFGIDSVMFIKTGENQYNIDFTEIGTYEEYIENYSNNYTE